MADDSRDNHSKQDVEECFKIIRKRMKDRDAFGYRWGCFKDDIGRCLCSADSNLIFHSYMPTFDEAIGNLKKNTGGFKSIKAETFEGQMYVSYSCNV